MFARHSLPQRNNWLIHSCAILLLFSLSAIAAQTNPPPQIILEQTLKTDSCYVGQPLTYSVTWHALPAIGRFKAVDINVPIMATNSFKIYESHKKRDLPNANSLGIPLGGTRAIAHVSTTTLNGHNYTSLRTSKVVVPATPGTFMIAPASITCFLSEIFVPNSSPRSHRPKGSGNLYQYPVYFNNNFFDLDIPPHSKKLQAFSNPLQLKVMPLPTPVPQPFSGLVGNYTFAVNAATNTIRNGDPLQLILTVKSAADYLEPVNIPSLRQYPGFTNSFHVVDDRRLISINAGLAAFSQTVYPDLPPGKHTFPALELICFNPATKKYQFAKSKQFIFTITQSAKSATIHPSPTQRHYGIILMIILISIGIIPIVIFRRRRSAEVPNTSPQSPDINHAMQLLKTKLTSLKKTPTVHPSEKYTEINTAISTFFSTKLTDHTPGAITTSDILGVIREAGLSESIFESSKELMRRIDFQRFAPLHSTSPKTLESDIASAITIAEEFAKAK